jgi:tyrosyl-tRNA synthetase
MVIGRFTSLVGDPSDKDKVRAQLTLEQAGLNAETYAEQAFKILDPDRTQVVYNDAWLSKLTLKDFIQLASHFTMQQFLARDAFRSRWEREDPIFLHEFFYAIMQGYDAYHLKTDVQIGGSDQLFNIVTAARKLMEVLGEKPNIGVIHGILPGTDGVVKMSKSLGNHIPLISSPEDMYGKVMSVPDAAMGDYFRLVTRWTPTEIEEIEAGMASGMLHPRDVKMQLAREIVEIYHGEQAGEPAEAAFRRVFQKREIPENLAEITLKPGQTLVDVMLQAEFVSSLSEARRLIKQGGVRLDGATQDDQRKVLDIPKSQVLRVGKRRFVRLLPPEK